MQPERIPRATYRLQLSCKFTFADAECIAGYLAKLGIGELYLSPIFQAQRQSCHCYDVTDYSLINMELGGEDGFFRLSSALRERGMGIVLDVVPNHMGIIDESNGWWQNVLENGPASPYAGHFDIDWSPPKAQLRNRVLLPMLGAQYGEVLEAGQLKLVFRSSGFYCTYFDKRFPIDPRTWPRILEPALAKARRSLPEENEHLIEMMSIITGLEHLPARTDITPEHIQERQREKEVQKRRLAALTAANGTLRTAIEDTVTEFNGTPEDPASYDLFDKLLHEQAYRLAYWRVAADEINYRRFFDVNELAAIRVEQPRVFHAVHELTFRLIAGGHVTGLRIDHPDGLFDPRQYFMDLQKGCSAALSGNQPTAIESPVTEQDRVFWVVAEKILGREERLRPDWAICGTTGYDYLNLLNGIFIDPAGHRGILKNYIGFTGVTLDFPILAYHCKKLILDVAMAAELLVLSRRLDRISEQHRSSRDFTLWSLQKALSEIIACFPVYRTYTSCSTGIAGEDDRQHIVAAVRAAKRRNRAINPTIFDFIGAILLLQYPEELAELDRTVRRDFVMRFQQLTSPIMAKGIEDTAFYRAYPLASLNEVGNEPEHFHFSTEEFHKRNAERLEKYPHALLATSTHDTKRSEDVRARINVLSEIPEEWAQAVRQWRQFNRKKKDQVDGLHVPSGNEEYLLYQTMIGAWPLCEEDVPGVCGRLKAYMIKAGREAKLHTSWNTPNESYEAALTAFVGRILERVPRPKNFLDGFRRFHARIAPAAAIKSLSQVLLKITCPGVPDFYQGSELWDFSLVDPDNRRPVDFARREQLLNELATRNDTTALAKELVEQWTDGRIKLHVTHRALVFRSAHLPVFQDGRYIPLAASGPGASSVCAFARCAGKTWAITLAPRLTMRLIDGGVPVNPSAWRDTILSLPEEAPEHWSNEFTGENLSASGRQLHLEEVLRHFPVALLHGTIA